MDQHATTRSTFTLHLSPSLNIKQGCPDTAWKYFMQIYFFSCKLKFKAGSLVGTKAED